jgi:hypothetical protein
MEKELLETIYYLKKQRENYEPIFYLSRKAYDGKYFVVWDRSSRQIVDKPVINKLYSIQELPEIAKQADDVENFLISSSYIFTVVPKFLSQGEDVKQTIYLSLLAKELYDRFRLSQQISIMVKNALFDNTSFVEVAVNDDESFVQLRTYDAFDILFDYKKQNWDDVKFVVKVIKKKIRDVQNSSLYTLPKNITSGDPTFFGWKDIYYQEKYFSFTPLEKDEIILFETYSTEKGYLKIKTIDGKGNVLRDDEYSNLKRIPILPFRFYSGDWFQKSFVFRLLPVARTLSLIASRMDDLILKLAKGGWIVQENEDVNGELNEQVGQVIRYSATKPEQIQIPVIPSWISNWFAILLNIGERYGRPNIMAGSLPQKSSGLRANKMLESLTANIMQSNSSVLDSLRLTIKEILEVSFMFLYEIWKIPQPNIVTAVSKEHGEISFVSEKYASENSNAIKIPASFSKFSVEIDNAMGYTLDAKKQNAVMLFKLGIIGKETLKRIFNLGSTAYLLEAEQKPMYETEDFQKLMALAPTLPPDKRQAVIDTLNLLAQITQGNQNVQAMPQTAPNISEKEVTGNAINQVGEEGSS